VLSVIQATLSLKDNGDNEQWIETGKGCGSDQNWPSLRYSSGHNIMPTIGTVTVQD